MISMTIAKKLPEPARLAAEFSTAAVDDAEAEDVVADDVAAPELV